MERMRHAVWVDLVNMLLWAGAAVGMGIRWWKGRRCSECGGETTGVFRKEGVYASDGGEAGYEVRET